MFSVADPGDPATLIPMTRLTLVQGDTALLRFAIVDANDDPIDIEPYTIVFTIKRSTQDPDSAAIWQGDSDGSAVVKGTPTTDGLVDVTVPADNMELVRAGRPVYWDIELTAGDVVFTPLQGTILTTSEITGA